MPNLFFRSCMRKHQEIRAMRSQLKKIEDLGAAMEEALILDNKYTEHSTVGLAQQWDQLDQLGMRMQHNLEQQIQASRRGRNSPHLGSEEIPPIKSFPIDETGASLALLSANLSTSEHIALVFQEHHGVTEEALKEFSMMFKHFDKDKSGRLNHQEFKSCLRSLGYDLPMVEEGEPDPEFEAILDTNLSREQADYCISHRNYCISHMKPYMDSKGRSFLCLAHADSHAPSL
ncbi:putative Spectrin alpha chain brain-like protein [Naja naja]|nr:putative Spectrin alpha chain brain-like protein [Naja naja]